jgi:RimJ/RimL family protein N-acetyltransferase
VTGEKVSLRPRGIEDAADEYRWRTDEELCRLDATIPIELTYSDFLERYYVELEYPGLTYTIAVDTLEGRHIGNCSLFNFDFLTGNAEVGLMIGEKEFWDQGYGRDALKIFLLHIFQTSNLNTILLRTLDWNKRAQACFIKCGFTPCGTMAKEGYNFIVMEIKRFQVVAGNQ